MAPHDSSIQYVTKYSLFFLCRTKKDKTLKWYRDGTLLLNSDLAKNESYRIKISAKGHLKFAEVKPRDAGRYNCSYHKDKRNKEWIITGRSLTRRLRLKCI